MKIDFFTPSGVRRDLFGSCHRGLLQFSGNLPPAFSRLDMKSGPSDWPLQMFLDSPFDLASPDVCHIIPPKIVIVSEEKLKDMAERQVD
jgi:hypothetical protein